MNRNQYCILVVDDESSIRHALALGLASREFVVDMASNRAEALEMAAEGGYDILIVDLNLPDGDGIAVIQEIRARYPMIIPYLITAYGAPEIALEAKRHGVGHYFEKPFDMRELKECISRALDERRRRQAIQGCL